MARKEREEVWKLSEANHISEIKEGEHVAVMSKGEPVIIGRVQHVRRNVIHVYNKYGDIYHRHYHLGDGECIDGPITEYIVPATKDTINRWRKYYEEKEKEYLASATKIIKRALDEFDSDKLWTLAAMIEQMEEDENDY